MQTWEDPIHEVAENILKYAFQEMGEVTRGLLEKKDPGTLQEEYASLVEALIKISTIGTLALKKVNKLYNDRTEFVVERGKLN